jgi:hypothetical protein
MPGIVLIFPILPGKSEAWRRFCQELAGSRSSLYEASRRRLGITHEQMALVESAFGATATTIMEAPDMVRVLAELISSDLPFDDWYRARIESLYGVTMTWYARFAQLAPANQVQELLFEWHLPAARHG